MKRPCSHSEATPSPARIASAITLVVAVCAALGGDSRARLRGPRGRRRTASLPQLAFEPGSYDFGLHEANRENSQTSFQLRNVGSVPAPIYSIHIVGSGSGAFWTGNSDCFNHPLEPSETCSIQVNFNPYDAVPFSAQLRAESDGGTSFTADLSGEGGRPELTAATNPTNFGSVPVGSGGVTKTIDVTNEGNMPGGAFIAVISGGAVGSFHLLDENCTGIPLSPDATCNLQVNFDPISTGAKTARLFLAGDGEGGAQITLTGVGLEPSHAAGRIACRLRASAAAPLPSRSRSRAASAATAVSAATWLRARRRLAARHALSGRIENLTRWRVRRETRFRRGCVRPAPGWRAGRAPCGSKRRRWRPTPPACPARSRRPRPTRRPSWSRATARRAPPSSSASTRSTSARAGGRRSASAPAAAATSRSPRG